MQVLILLNLTGGCFRAYKMSEGDFNNRLEQAKNLLFSFQRYTHIVLLICGITSCIGFSVYLKFVITGAEPQYIVIIDNLLRQFTDFAVLPFLILGSTGRRWNKWHWGCYVCLWLLLIINTLYAVLGFNPELVFWLFCTLIYIIFIYLCVKSLINRNK